ncbi:MAG: hypothetical protein OHK0039_35820 [Bacteroidia bacterium]
MRHFLHLACLLLTVQVWAQVPGKRLYGTETRFKALRLYAMLTDSAATAATASTEIAAQPAASDSLAAQPASDSLAADSAMVAAPLAGMLVADSTSRVSGLLPGPGPAGSVGDSILPVTISTPVVVRDTVWLPLSQPQDTAPVRVVVQGPASDELAAWQLRLARLEGLVEGMQHRPPDSAAYWRARALSLENALRIQRDQQETMLLALERLRRQADQPAYVPPQAAVSVIQPVAPQPAMDSSSINTDPLAPVVSATDTLRVAAVVDTLVPVEVVRVEAVDSLAPRPAASVLVAPTPVGVQIVETRRTDTLSLLVLAIPQASVFFDKGRTTLLPEDRSMLTQLAATLVAYPALQVVLKGYADKSGNPQLNMRLSELRTAEVRAVLEQQGVAPERIRVLFFGDQQTRYQDGALDRRVDIVLYE